MAAIGDWAAAPRILIIGLDGASNTWLRPLAQCGRLPTLARLLREGTHGPLASTVPPHTAAAWPSLMTGRNPGKHGLFAFERMDVAHYAGLDGFATSETLVGRTIFDAASAAGMRVAALRVPMTYPIWPVNGVMASGYPAPRQTERCLYPATLAGVMAPVSGPLHGTTPDQTFANLQDEIEVLTTSACQLLASDRYDLFMLVYQQPDQAQHLFWRYTDPASPLYSEEGAAAYGDLIARCYEAVDAAMAHLLAFTNRDTLVLVVSDHGAERAPATAFQTNLWLRALGLQAPLAQRSALPLAAGVPPRVAGHGPAGRRPGQPRSVQRRASQHTTACDWAHTVAYWFPMHEQMEAIAINLRGRQPNGIVEPGEEYTQVRERLIRALRMLRQPDSMAPLVTEIYRREDVFWGPYAVRAPDLLYRLAPGFQSDNALTGPLFSRIPAHALERHSAWHDRAGVLIAHGPGIAPGSEIVGARLLDIAPTVLAALGLPRPADLDGQPLAGIVPWPPPRPAVRALPPLRATTTTTDADTPSATGAAVQLSEAEEESIRRRLRALGYQ